MTYIIIKCIIKVHPKILLEIIGGIKQGMDNSIVGNSRRINYYPLMWVLLVSSFLAVLAFLFRSFIIHTDEGTITVSAFDLLSRSSSSILSDPKYAILKIAILIGISLGIVNVSMSLWQAGYTNVRNMKLVNNLRFVITGFALIVLVYLSGAMSEGTVLVKETFFGAFGINIVIYFIAYAINLYYGVRERVAIVNYKAICALMPIVFYTFWTLDFLTVSGVHISGINAIYFVNIPGLTYSVLEDAVRGSTLYAVLSQAFLFIYLYNVIANFLLVILNKCYRRFCLNKYIFSAMYSVAFGLFCVYVQGSTFEGSMGIFLIALMYVFLAIYTIAAYRTLKRGVYEGKEEIIDNDEDRYFDDQTGFITAVEDENDSNGDSGLVYIKDGKRGVAPGIKAEKDLNKVNYAVKREIPQVPTSKVQPAPVLKQDAPKPISQSKPIEPPTVSKTEIKPVTLKSSIAPTAHVSKYGLSESAFIQGEDAALEDEAKLNYDPSYEEYAVAEKVNVEESSKIIKLQDTDSEESIVETISTENEKSGEIEAKLSESEEKDVSEMSEYFKSDELFIKESPEKSEKEIEETVEAESENSSETEEITIKLNDSNDGIYDEDKEAEKLLEESEDFNADGNEEEDFEDEDELKEFYNDSEEYEEDIAAEYEEDIAAEYEDSIIMGEDNEEAETSSEEVENLDQVEIIEELAGEDDNEIEDEEKELVATEVKEEIEFFDFEEKSDAESLTAEVEEVEYQATDNARENEADKSEESVLEPIMALEYIKTNNTEKVSGADGAGSYYKTLALIDEDSEEDEVKSFTEVRRKNIADTASSTEDQSEIIERLVTEDFKPEGIITVTDDHFYMMMPYRMKKEFTEVYMNPSEYLIRRIPQYVIGGDNSEFFASVLKYIDVSGKKITSELILLLYEYVISLYSEDTEFISNCNRKVLDALHQREDREKTASDITEEVCIKEIKLTIKTDLTRTMPVIKRLILIYMRKKKYDEALQLCETAIRLNFTDNTVGGYEGRRRRILRMMEKERG